MRVCAITVRESNVNTLISRVLEDELYYTATVLFVCVVSFEVGLLIAVLW